MLMPFVRQVLLMAHSLALVLKDIKDQTVLKILMNVFKVNFKINFKLNQILILLCVI